MEGGWTAQGPATVLKHKKRKILAAVATSLSAVLLLPVSSFAAEDAKVDKSYVEYSAIKESDMTESESHIFDVDNALKLIRHKQIEKISVEQEEKRIDLAKQEADKKKAAELQKQKEKEEDKKEEKTDNENVSDEAETEPETETETENTNNDSSSDFVPPQSSALYEIDNPDPNYHGSVINLTEEDRNVLRGVIMGEAGGEGFVGACILAQTIRDNWLYAGYSSASEVQYGCQYSGWIDGANDDVENAITFIFDQGGVAVQHRIRYMYCTSMCYSDWHETQNYILTYGDVRFFDSWN